MALDIFSDGGLIPKKKKTAIPTPTKTFVPEKQETTTPLEPLGGSILDSKALTAPTITKTSAAPPVTTTEPYGIKEGEDPAVWVSQQKTEADLDAMLRDQVIAGNPEIQRLQTAVDENTALYNQYLAKYGAYDWRTKKFEKIVADFSAQLAKATSDISADVAALKAGATPKIIYASDGRPIAQGFIYDGVFYLTKSLTGLYEGLGELGAIDIPTLTEWMQTQGFQFYDAMEIISGMQELVTQISSPETQATWQQGGLDWAGQLMGLEPGGYEGTMQDLLAGVRGGISGQEGFTPEEQDLFKRQMYGERMAMREDFAMMVDSLQASGRDVMAILKADEAIRTISNTQLASRAQRMVDNYALKETQWQAQKQQFDTMLQTGMMAATEYIQRQREHAMLQLTAVSQEAAVMFQQNEQYLMQYQQDLAGLEAGAQAIYNDIMLQLGVDSALIEWAEGYYEMMLAPLYTQMELTAFQAELQAQSAEQTMSMWGTVLDFLGTGVSALLSGLL